MNMPLRKWFVRRPSKPSHPESFFASELANCGGRKRLVKSLALRYKKGFTFVEISVGVLVLSAFMTSLFMIYNESLKGFKRSSNKSSSLQAAYILFQKIRTDVQMIVFDENHPIQIDDSLGASKNKISFYCFDPAKHQVHQIRLEKIIYEFDPQSNLVKRNGVVATSGKFMNVEFVLENPNLQANPPIYGNQILCAIQGIGDQAALSLKNGEDVSKDKTSFIGGFFVMYKSQREEFPTWLMNRSSYPVN